VSIAIPAAGKKISALVAMIFVHSWQKPYPPQAKKISASVAKDIRVNSRAHHRQKKLVHPWQKISVSIAVPTAGKKN
jgi:hypothetical protein